MNLVIILCTVLNLLYATDNSQRVEDLVKELIVKPKIKTLLSEGKCSIESIRQIVIERIALECFKEDEPCEINPCEIVPKDEPTENKDPIEHSGLEVNDPTGIYINPTGIIDEPMVGEEPYEASTKEPKESPISTPVEVVEAREIPVESVDPRETPIITPVEVVEAKEIPVERVDPNEPPISTPVEVVEPREIPVEKVGPKESPIIAPVEVVEPREIPVEKVGPKESPILTPVEAREIPMEIIDPTETPIITPVEAREIPVEIIDPTETPIITPVEAREIPVEIIDPTETSIITPVVPREIPVERVDPKESPIITPVVPREIPVEIIDPTETPIITPVEAKEIPVENIDPKETPFNIPAEEEPVLTPREDESEATPVKEENPRKISITMPVEEVESNRNPVIIPDEEVVPKEVPITEPIEELAITEPIKEIELKELPIIISKLPGNEIHSAHSSEENNLEPNEHTPVTLPADVSSKNSPVEHAISTQESEPRFTMIMISGQNENEKIAERIVELLKPMLKHFLIKNFPYVDYEEPVLTTNQLAEINNQVSDFFDDYNVEQMIFDQLNHSDSEKTDLMSASVKEKLLQAGIMLRSALQNMRSTEKSNNMNNTILILPMDIYPPWSTLEMEAEGFTGTE